MSMLGVLMHHQAPLAHVAQLAALLQDVAKVGSGQSTVAGGEQKLVGVFVAVAMHLLLSPVQGLFMRGRVAVVIQPQAALLGFLIKTIFVTARLERSFG